MMVVLGRLRKYRVLHYFESPDVGVAEGYKGFKPRNATKALSEWTPRLESHRAEVQVQDVQGVKAGQTIS